MNDQAIALEKQVEETRAAISACLLEIDEITLQINPQIETDYAVKIGCLETELLKCQIAARRARRKYELAQIRKNRGEAVTDQELEEQLDEEFSSWEAELNKAIETFMKELERRANAKPLSLEDSRELKQLHRELIKRLHPDMRPDLGMEGRRYFEIAQAAFKSGDLELLRSIEVATAHLCREEQLPEEPDELLAESALLEAQLHVVQERLEALKKSLPYTLRDKLANPAWVQQQTDSLKAQIKQQEQVCAAYEQRLREMKAESDG